MDEPIGSLDAKLREEMRVELKRLHIHIQATTLYVTHDQVEAMSMADRIAVMNEGVLQQVGTPSEIYDHPANLFVAQFIGSPIMNVLDCAVESGESGMKVGLDREDAALSFSISSADALMEKKVRAEKLVLGIRPEAIHIERGDEAGFSASQGPHHRAARSVRHRGFQGRRADCPGPKHRVAFWKDRVIPFGFASMKAEFTFSTNRTVNP